MCHSASGIQEQCAGWWDHVCTGLYNSFLPEISEISVYHKPKQVIYVLFCFVFLLLFGCCGFDCLFLKFLLQLLNNYSLLWCSEIPFDKSLCLLTWFFFSCGDFPTNLKPWLPPFLPLLHLVWYIYSEQLHPLSIFIFLEFNWANPCYFSLLPWALHIILLVFLCSISVQIHLPGAEGPRIVTVSLQRAHQCHVQQKQYSPFPTGTFPADEM